MLSVYTHHYSPCKKEPCLAPLKVSEMDPRRSESAALRI